MKASLFSLAAFLLLISCRAQKPQAWIVQENDNSLFWKVSGNGLEKPSFLYGTFHLLCKEDIHLSEAMVKAVRQSDKVYMEMDLDDPSVMLSAMIYMNMKDGKTLKTLYSPEEYARIEKYFSDSLKMPMMVFQKMKPYFLIALLYPKMMKCSAPSGVDQEIVKIAKQENKEIDGLETMQFQASVFDSIPYEWQAKELLKNIDSFPKYKKEFESMVSMYKTQNMDSLENLMNKSEFGENDFNNILLGNRNKNWTNQLNTIMKKESVFVAVGAGHLPGKEGMIALLRAEGYTVQPIKNE